jgi:hypothetical protein
VKSKNRYLNLIQSSPTFATLLTLLPKLSHFPPLTNQAEAHQESRPSTTVNPNICCTSTKKRTCQVSPPHPPSKPRPNDQYTPHPGIRAQPYRTTSHFSGRLEPHTRVSRLHQGSTVYTLSVLLQRFSFASTSTHGFQTETTLVD